MALILSVVGVPDADVLLAEVPGLEDHESDDGGGEDRQQRQGGALPRPRWAS